ncbi:ClpXP adapter SpxH family protein [Halalkalibacter urbisdiaboli]|uniref:ClpXP adapter SpxH family protein n=1 Tax=Halalkalibacter urbisdiaboli TaxID=1960589 RepID=UPI000B43E133|nr:ClpXP adapter SpxH family protein [Halalkalibacter urbisdiaboli]
MEPRKPRTSCDNEIGVCGLDPEHPFEPKKQKPLEIYTFIDPLCAECWSFEPLLKKLQVEYGSYFRIRVIIAGRLKSWNFCQETKKGVARKSELAMVWEKIASQTGMSCDGDVWFENQWSSPYLASIAIKAAELQGPHAGARFLRKMREFLFLDKQNITDEDIIVQCAEAANLDMEEFKKDLESPLAEKALKCDLKTTNEMDVNMVPTFVFFNDNVEEEGVKVTGFYPYHVYVDLIKEMLGFEPKRAPRITLEAFLKRYLFVATIEVAVVFDMSEEEAEKELKTLVLQQKVEAVPVKYGTFWRYLG